MRTYFFYMLLSILLSTVDATSSQAQKMVAAVNTANATLPVKSVSETTDGMFNFKNFEIEVSEEGDYYAGFWLLPSKYQDGNFTKFNLYVNGVSAGVISPSKGNWQFAQIDGNERLHLLEGKNVISLATPIPEFPAVENIKVSQEEDSVRFSSDLYENFLADASNGITYKTGIQNDAFLQSNIPAHVAGMAYYSNVPLLYSFYGIFSFTEGQEIFLTSTSKAEHVIDVVYYGKPVEIRPPHTESSNVPITGIMKPRRLYIPATSEEMQGLNWNGFSEKALNSKFQISTVQFTIPKTGLYLIKLRCNTNGDMATANLNINGAYYYEEVPISLSWIDCEIPADGNEYASMTCCNNFGVDDPMLFIHGNANDKIVGFDDDGPVSKLQQYNLSNWDSFISQKYFVKTSKISVCNYSSSNPVSKCSIIARLFEGTNKTLLKAMPEKEETTGISSLPTTDENIKIPNIIYRGEYFTIKAKDKIKTIQVFNLCGNKVCRTVGNGNVFTSSASALNLTQPGLYIINVETTKDVYSNKVVVK